MTIDQQVSEVGATRRPFGVTAVAVLQVVSAVYSALLLYQADLSVRYVQETGYTDVANLVLDVLALVVAVGLLQLHRWAWVLMMSVLAIDMGFSLWSYYDGTPEYVRMALNVIVVFYLNSRDVRHAFGYVTATEEPAVRG